MTDSKLCKATVHLDYIGRCERRRDETFTKRQISALQQKQTRILFVPGTYRWKKNLWHFRDMQKHLSLSCSANDSTAFGIRVTSL